MARQLAYLGPMARVDMRQVVGFKLDDESDKAKKFIFFGKVAPAVHARRSDDDRREAERQHREGVEMTNDQALAILTAPDRPTGFADLTDQAKPATGADRLALGQDQIDQRLADEAMAPMLTTGAAPATEYEMATPIDEANDADHAKASGAKVAAKK